MLLNDVFPVHARTHINANTHFLPPDLVLLLVFEDGLKEGPALVAGRLLVKHASLNNLLVHVQFVLGSSQDFLFNTVDRAKTQHAHLVLLTDTVGSVLSLQVLEEEKESQCSSNVTLCLQNKSWFSIGYRRVGRSQQAAITEVEPHL